MTCEVIRDLLPLCADGVASEESYAAVKAHIRTCDECRALYKKMCSPMEAQEAPQEPDYMAAVRQQKKEKRRFILRVYGIALGVFLLLALVWNGKFIFQNQAWVSQTILLTAEEMVAEMPQALLTREEKDLAKEIFSLSEVKKAFEEGAAKETGVYLPEELYRELMTRSGVNPDAVKHGYADILGESLILDYYNDEYRCILEFIDTDESGNADVLRKLTSARVPKEGVQTEIPHDIPIYTSEINAALIGEVEDEFLEDLNTTYKKSVQKRDWLYFLKDN